MKHYQKIAQKILYLFVKISQNQSLLKFLSEY